VRTSGKIEDVVDALRARDFKFVGRTFDGQLRFLGQLRCSLSAQDCELQVDPQFVDIPSIQLLDLPSSLGPITPHINSDGQLCYIAKGTIILDIFDPVGQTLACIQRAEEVFDSILKGDMVADLEEEFYAYWDGIPCLVDIPNQQFGRQNTLTVKLDGRFIVIVTDDALRTAVKLKSLNLDIADKKLLTYRVRTCAKPRPNLKADWPPKKICDLLAWQRLLDQRCRKKIEERLQQGLKTKAKGALILIESPLLTYGFVVLFNREKTKNGKHAIKRANIHNFDVIPVSVMRIDDHYMAQRNIPGMKTLAGKRIVLIGCGTIGGFLAEMLVKAGLGTSGGELTLVDFETLSPQNIGRHRLGFPSLFVNKAMALAEELRRGAPGAKIKELTIDARLAQLGKFDLIIDATGEESLGHWLCKQYVAKVAMLTTWVEGPGTAVRALIHTKADGACYRCLFEANRKGLLPAITGKLPMILAGQGCEGLYVPFPASVSVQAACLASEMVLAWVNGVVSPALRTKLIDTQFILDTPDCDPPKMDSCPICFS
jgi:molybdopterin/thiamine biosynthesis adenylyltransferase